MTRLVTRLVAPLLAVAASLSAAQAADQPVEVFVRFRNQMVITEQGYLPYDEFVKDTLKENKESIEVAPQTTEEKDPNQAFIDK